jgi:two-component system, response regulator
MAEIADGPILLVEDNSDDEFLAIHTLHIMGFNDVTVVRDGREAVTMLLGDETAGTLPRIAVPKFILLDLRLPKLDGLEVLRMLRGNVRTSKLLVFILTSSEDPHDKDVCRDLNVLAFIPKPLKVDSFRETLERSGVCL